MYEDDYWFNKKVEEKKEINEKQEQLENKLLFAGNILMYLMIAYAFILFLVIFFYENLLSFTNWKILGYITPNIFIPNLGDKFTVSPYLLGGLNFLALIFFGLYATILFFATLSVCNGKLRPLGKNKYNMRGLVWYENSKNLNNYKIFGIKNTYYGVFAGILFGYVILYFGHYDDFYFKLSKFELLITYFFQLCIWLLYGITIAKILYVIFGGKITWSNIID